MFVSWDHNFFARTDSDPWCGSGLRSHESTTRPGLLEAGPAPRLLVSDGDSPVPHTHEHHPLRALLPPDAAMRWLQVQSDSVKDAREGAMPARSPHPVGRWPARRLAVTSSRDETSCGVVPLVRRIMEEGRSEQGLAACAVSELRVGRRPF